MYETAKQLIDTTIKAHMQMFEIDRPARRPGIGFEARQMWGESIFGIMTERRPHVLSTSSI